MFVKPNVPCNLRRAIIRGVVHEGLTVTTQDGKPAKFAIIDESGNVIESGAEVAKAAYETTLAVYQNFRIGMGHLRVFTAPPSLTTAPVPLAPTRPAPQ